MSLTTESAAEEISRPSRLLLVVDMECWQADHLTDKNAISIFSYVLAKVYHTLGQMGYPINELCTLVKLIGGNKEVDSLLERFTGVNLVGPGRGLSNMEAALIYATRDPEQFVAMIATDQQIEDNNPILEIIGSRLAVAEVRILTWSHKEGNAVVKIATHSIPSLGVVAAPTICSPDKEAEDSPGLQQDILTVDSVMLSENSKSAPIPALPAQQVRAVQALLEQVSVVDQGAIDFDDEDDVPVTNYMDFVPLVKTVREYQYSLSAKKKLLRSVAALDLMDSYRWPIGEAGYTTFRRYTREAETAGFVRLGDCEHGPTIYSTGRLEAILEIKPSNNYTQGWPRVH